MYVLRDKRAAKLVYLWTIHICAIWTQCNVLYTLLSMACMHTKYKLTFLYILAWHSEITIFFRWTTIIMTSVNIVQCLRRCVLRDAWLYFGLNTINTAMFWFIYVAFIFTAMDDKKIEQYLIISNCFNFQNAFIHGIRTPMHNNNTSITNE